MARDSNNRRNEPADRPRGTEAVPPPDRPSIPDPLGDDRHVLASGELTGESPDRDGLLGAGSEPRPDGGVDQHPIHDDDSEDLGPDDYEELTDSPETGFLRRQDEERPDDEDGDEEEVEDAETSDRIERE
jgi:hypothetical protein